VMALETEATIALTVRDAEELVGESEQSRAITRGGRSLALSDVSPRRFLGLSVLSS
jgi:hypothetical protein